MGGIRAAAGRGHRGQGNGRTPFGDPNAPNPGQPNAPGQPGQNPAEQKPPAFLLLRYFDYKVEPGKHYVYRVRLALANPNYIPPPGRPPTRERSGVSNLKPGYLKDPKLAEKQWLETDWSEPSPVISMPRDTRVLALSVTPGRESRPRHAGQVGASGASRPSTTSRSSAARSPTSSTQPSRTTTPAISSAAGGVARRADAAAGWLSRSGDAAAAPGAGGRRAGRGGRSAGTPAPAGAGAPGRRRAATRPAEAPGTQPGRAACRAGMA